MAMSAVCTQTTHVSIQQRIKNLKKNIFKKHEKNNSNNKVELTYKKHDTIYTYILIFWFCLTSCELQTFCKCIKRGYIYILF